MQSLGLGKKWSEICRVFGVSEVGTCWDLERSTVGYLTELTVNMNVQSEYFSLRNAQLLTFYCGIFWWQNCNELPRPVLGWAVEMLSYLHGLGCILSRTKKAGRRPMQRLPRKYWAFGAHKACARVAAAGRQPGKRGETEEGDRSEHQFNLVQWQQCGISISFCFLSSQITNNPSHGVSMSRCCCYNQSHWSPSMKSSEMKGLASSSVSSRDHCTRPA